MYHVHYTVGMKYCNYHDVTSVYSLNSWKLPGRFSYGLGTRLMLTSKKTSYSLGHKLAPACGGLGKDKYRGLHIAVDSRGTTKFD